MSNIKNSLEKFKIPLNKTDICTLISSQIYSTSYINHINYFKSVVGIGLLPDFYNDFKNKKYINCQINNSFQINWDEQKKAFSYQVKENNSFKEVHQEVLRQIDNNSLIEIEKMMTFYNLNDNSNYSKIFIKDKTSKKRSLSELINYKEDKNLIPSLRLKEIYYLLLKYNIEETSKRKQEFLLKLKCKIIEKIKSLFTVEKYVLIGFFKINKNISEKCYPISCHMRFDYFEDIEHGKNVLIKPLDTMKISKPNIYVENTLNDIEKEKYSSNKMLSVEIEELEYAYHLYGKEKTFNLKNDTLENKKNWNDLIDFICSKFERFNNDTSLDYSECWLLFESNKSINTIYQAYKDVIKHLLLTKDETNNVLYSLLKKETKEQYKKSFPLSMNNNKIAWIGMLKENKLSPNESSYFTLNENQKIFCQKIRNNFSDEVDVKNEKTNLIVLNGPPGTGKTTVLQSVVSTYVVDAVLENKPMPIIFGCSATNQAKNNIINGFSYDEVHSYQKKDIYQRWVGLNEINCCRDYGFSLETINREDLLNKEIENLIKNRYLIEQNLLKKINQFQEYTLINNEQNESLKQLDTLIINEGLSSNLLLFFETQKQIANNSIQKNTLSTLKQLLTNIINEYKRLCNIFFKINEKCKNDKNYYYNIFHIILDIFKQNNQKINVNILYSIIESSEKNMADFFEIIMAIIDNIFKPLAFHIAMRYQEVLFVERLKKIKKTITTNFKNNVQEKYALMSLIYPVFVSTFHSLYNKTYYIDEFQNKHPNIGFIDILLIDEAGQASNEIAALSLLLSKKAIIIGDAYQIEPVYGIEASFDYSLYNVRVRGKEQKTIKEFAIKNFSTNPWNCHNSSIIKLAQKFSIWHQYEELEKGLYLLEHNRCPVELIEICDELMYKNKLQFTITPCYKERNELVYNNKINEISKQKMSNLYIRNKEINSKNYLLKGQKPLVFVPVQDIFIEKNNLVNKLEIIEIFNWLDNNYKEITTKTDKSLKDIVSIITPYKEQAKIIKLLGKTHQFINLELNEYFFDENENLLTIGTVHSLQGAERAIILFSTVLSSSNTGRGFVDRNPSILNVAISRAKQSVYVFGNQKRFENSEFNTSTNILWKYLKKYN